MSLPPQHRTLAFYSTRNVNARLTQPIEYNATLCKTVQHRSHHLRRGSSRGFRPGEADVAISDIVRQHKHNVWLRCIVATRSESGIDSAEPGEGAWQPLDKCHFVFVRWIEMDISVSRFFPLARFLGDVRGLDQLFACDPWCALLCRYWR